VSKPLTWTNDPLLFDLEPLVVNQWINANELIRLNRRNEIFVSGKNLFNLYPIMVRKNDFVKTTSSDRVMARFPFLVLDEPTQKLIVDKILLLSEVTRDYFYKSINKSILEWKEDILHYLARGTLPFPILRCCFELEPNLQTLYITPFLHFTSARGEPFKMPTELTKELAYLAGMINGDGNLQKYAVRIVDYSIKNIEQLKGMFEEYFAQTGNIVYKTPNSPELVITNLWVVRLFSFLTDHPIGTKKYASLTEPLLFKKEPFRSYYWSGVMDADGSYKSKQATFSSSSKPFTQDFQTYLIENEIVTKLNARDDGTFTIYIPNKYHSKLITLLISLHPEKSKEFNQLATTISRQAKIFSDIKISNLINGYFNFSLLSTSYVLGLADQIIRLRGTLGLRQISKKLGVFHNTISDIENGIRGIEIQLLERLLRMSNLNLMDFLTEYILFYTKNKPQFNFKKMYVAGSYDENYRYYIKNFEKDVDKWELVDIKEILYKKMGVNDWRGVKEKFGDSYKIVLEQMMADFAKDNAKRVIRLCDPHKAAGVLKELIDKSKKEKDKIFHHERENFSDFYIKNGGLFAFYSNKLGMVDGELTPTILLTDFWDDIAWEGIQNEGKVIFKNAKKPEKLLKRIIELSTEENDLVLDFFLGSGTTCAVSHKLGRQYIGIEQLDYGENSAVNRLKNVIGKSESEGRLMEVIVDCDTSGISKEVDWKGGGSFIYCELKELNEYFIKKIEKAKDSTTILKIWEEMKEQAFLSYRVNPTLFDENLEALGKLSIEQQKNLLIECLDLNSIYINFSEIRDEQYKINNKEIELNELFYSVK